LNHVGLLTLFSFSHDAHQDETGDQTEVLEEGVQGDEAIMTRQRPEIVGGQHCNCSQHAEPTGTQPHPASEDHEYGTADLDDDGRCSPQPRGLQAEMRLLRDCTWKIDELLDPADQEGRNQGGPRDRNQPWPGKYPSIQPGVSIFAGIQTAQQAQPSAPQKLPRSETGILADHARA